MNGTGSLTRGLSYVSWASYTIGTKPQMLGKSFRFLPHTDFLINYYLLILRILDYKCTKPIF
jgi:hypothetical protein